MIVPQVNNGKKPNEYLNAANRLPLPANTPFGNMALKHMKIILRLDHVNRKLLFVYNDWQIIQSNPFHQSEHLLFTEEIIYFLRVTTDELICLTYLIYRHGEDAAYPNRIKIKDIGGLLSAIKSADPDDAKFGQLFNKFYDWLDTFNKVANAYKHSFVNSDQTLAGMNEPTVPVLNNHQNNLDHGIAFYNLSLRDVIDNFNAFYNVAIEYLSNNSPPHLSTS